MVELNTSLIGEIPLQQLRGQQIASQMQGLQQQQQVQQGIQGLYAGGQQPTMQQLGQTLGQAGDPRAIQITQQQQKAQQEQVLQKAKFAQEMFKSILKAGAKPETLGAIAQSISESDPQVAAMFKVLSDTGQSVNLGEGSDYQVGVEVNDKGVPVNVRFNKSTLTSEPFLNAKGEVSTKPRTNISSRAFQSIIDTRTGEIIEGQAILDTPQEFQAIANTKENAATGKLEVIGIAPKETPVQKRGRDIKKAEKIKLITETIKDIEETEDVREKIGLVGNLMSDAFTATTKLPSGIKATASVPIAVAASRLGFENEYALTKGKLDAIRAQVGTLAREVGRESGVLNEGDVLRAFDFLPETFKSRSEQLGAFQQVQDQLNERIKQNGKKNNVPNYETYYLNFTGSLGKYNKGFVAFDNEDDAFDAFTKGEVKIGDKVLIRDGRMNPIEVIQ